MIQYYMYLYRSNLSGIAIFLVALVAHGGSKVPQLTLDDFGVLAMAPSRVPKVTFPARSVSNGGPSLIEHVGIVMNLTLGEPQILAIL